jgi:RNA polymerase sigma-70 factor (ECF subfamily)
MPPSPETEDFLLHYARNESRLFAYILTLLPRWTDAEEVLGETTLALWRSFDEFQSGTDFFAWASRVAFHRVLTFRKQRAKAGVEVDEAFLEAVAAQSEALGPELELRLAALNECVGRLAIKDRDLLRERYAAKGTIKSLAASVGRPVNTVYKALERIHRALLECINRRLSVEDRS